MRFSTKVTWLLGFFLVANLYLIPWLDKSPRATDVIGVLLACGLLLRFLGRGVNPRPFWGLAVLGVIPALWGLYALGIGDWTTVLRSIRWLVALPWAYALYFVVKEPKGRYVFLQGMIWGIIVNLGVIIMQHFGHDALMKHIGLAAQDEQWRSVYGITMIPGLHGLAGVSMSVISLIVPISLVLFFEFKKGPIIVLLGLGILAIGSALTLSRSPVIVASAIVAIVFLLHLRLKRSFRSALALLVIVAIVLIVYGPPGGWQRWIDPQLNPLNLAGRFHSQSLSIQLTVENPLGIGVQKSEELVSANHNAFLQASIEYGILFGLLVFILMTIMASRVLWGLGKPFWLQGVLALQMTGLFLFEDHLNNPTFIVLAALVSVSAMQWVLIVSRQWIVESARRRAYHDQ